MATSDLEPQEDGPAQGNRKGRQALTNVRRELSEEEISSPADDEVTTDVSNALWFPYKRLRAGDLVVVYSKGGRDKRKQLEDGHKAYFFYWDQDSSLWDDEHVAPVLLYAPQWASKAPQELTAEHR